MEKHKYVAEFLIEDTFKRVMSSFCSDKELINKLFNDVCKAYTSRSRHYHNMNHICYMCGLWEANKHKLSEANNVFLAIIYHDIVYKATRNDNEEKSAEYFLDIAAKHLIISEQNKTKIKNAIIATKHNKDSEKLWEFSTDIKYLLDFDLAILGTRHESEYEWYRKGVRKEYRIYPNVLYKPGRKKVLETFLSRKKIYLTKDFQEICEKNARKNLQNEIKLYLC